ncbi:MAG: HAMP domain-containing histidine kinase [Eggerthellaceae bacterium]|nr:HAMP domain-containing histidine kinase [Eggerthellaceae bacterium]
MTRLDRKAAQQAAALVADELSTARGKNNLVFYLVSRFIAVLLAVMVVESAVVWLESVTFLPLLRTLASSYVVDQTFETTSVIALVQWALELLQAIASVRMLRPPELAQRSLAAALFLAMLFLLAVPVVVGALVYAGLVVRKVRALQEQRERELAQIEQQRSQFITDIAHDLRTPLMAISGMSHALADGLVRDEAMRDEYLQSICDKSDKMGTLVNAVFDYSKLGSGSFELQRQPLDLSELMLREAAASFTDAEDAGMMLTTCIPEQQCTVFADPVQLSRVIANLIANAIKHNDAGVEVSVLLVKQAGVAYAIVADTGDPITANPDDLFQPFAQGDAVRSAERGGSGLGLSICKRIADMHEFDLGIAQPYGRFTKAFVLQCPLAD